MEWDEERVGDLFNEADKISIKDILINKRNIQDFYYWRYNHLGKYEAKSAYHVQNITQASELHALWGKNMEVTTSLKDSTLCMEDVEGDITNKRSTTKEGRGA